MLRRLRAQWKTLVVAVAGAFMLAATCKLAHAQQQISSRDREDAEEMLSQIHQVLKQNYYDTSFHGIDIDERYKTYREQIKSTKSIVAAYRVIEAYLAGLNDSHTLFIPPPNSRRVSYGFRLQMIGDKCFITDVRSATDAAQKLHPGDQIITLDGYTLSRADLWQLEYYLYLLPPKRTTEFTLRDVSGSERQEQVAVEFQEGKMLMDTSHAHWRLEIEKQQHMLRSRSAEEADVMFWKLPSFLGDEGAVSHMFAQAHRHRALIFDLRGNRGGLQNNLIFTLGNLFDHDVTVGKTVMRKGEKALVAKSQGNRAFTGQLIVLVDSRTSSAAEILARTVQIEHRGMVLGDRSAGSVMGAKFYLLKEGIGLVIPFGVELTEEDLIMTDGKSLEKQGVVPDVMLIPTAADIAEGRDPVLARAAELAGAKLDSASAGKMFPYEWAPN